MPPARCSPNAYDRAINAGKAIMTKDEATSFVEQFARARSRGRGEHLWRQDGKLHYPYADRVIEGREIGALCDITAAQAPHLTWEMIGWTHRDDVIVVEWLTTNRYGDALIRMTGVDRLTVKDGLIIEEIVYADTAPLRAMIEGAPLKAIMTLPESL